MSKNISVFYMILKIIFINEISYVGEVRYIMYLSFHFLTLLKDLSSLVISLKKKTI